MVIFAGVAIASAVCGFAALVRFDRERSFYPTVLIVIPAYYLLFAVMAADRAAMASEMIGFLLFATAAVLGFRRSRWIIVAALAGHGLLDAVHERLIFNPGAPGWWPGFCLSCDLAMAAILAATIVAGHRRTMHVDFRR